MHSRLRTELHSYMPMNSEAKQWNVLAPPLRKGRRRQHRSGCCADRRAPSETRRGACSGGCGPAEASASATSHRRESFRVTQRHTADRPLDIVPDPHSCSLVARALVEWLGVVFCVAERRPSDNDSGGWFDSTEPAWRRITKRPADNAPTCGRHWNYTGGFRVY